MVGFFSRSTPFWWNLLMFRIRYFGSFVMLYLRIFPLSRLRSVFPSNFFSSDSMSICGMLLLSWYKGKSGRSNSKNLLKRTAATAN